ncbi:hypothetical protein VE00_02707 [Pseudogymnoascus sp. WSF 3629]|nr:hypothetical protein VE00_02707 [Pseudogymnoascus sp. WSF 3629]
MGFLKSLGVKRKDKSAAAAASAAAANAERYAPSPSNPRYTQSGYAGRQVDWTVKLPVPVLTRIFSFVCPHAQDMSYESCERSAEEDACMLCDLRDLSYCVRVCRRWRKTAVPVLYQSIRIDAVHYCEREEILAERRKRRSFLNRNAEPEDTARARVRLLCRTLRDDTLGLGSLVLLVKTPYMTRETCKGDLARIVAVAPNLRYADFPDGFFTGDATCATLRQEVEQRCLDLRKMSYSRGAEKALEDVAGGYLWHNLEVLELSGLATDPTTVRFALGALRKLHTLHVKDMPSFSDEIFEPNQQFPPFPHLSTLHLENTPAVTIRAMQALLADPATARALTHLSLTTTAVHPSDIHLILSGAPSLRHFSLTELVSTPFPHTHIPPLQSRSLRTMHYEITAAPGASYTAGTAAYYSYLTTSLLAAGLPNLHKLYVRDSAFPESLIEFAPPRPQFAAESPPNPFLNNNRPLSTASSVYGSPPTAPVGSFNRTLSPMRAGPPGSPPSNPQARPRPQPKGPVGLSRELEVYTKSLDELEWNFARVEPARQPGRRGSMTALRPVSAYGLEAAGGRMSGSWGAGGVRRSVVVGNGFGGFLAVPVDEAGGATRRGSVGGSVTSGGSVSDAGGEWPVMGRGNKRESHYDIWR